MSNGLGRGNQACLWGDWTFSFLSRRKRSCLGGVAAFLRGKGGACLPVCIITCLGKIVIIVRIPSYISFLFVYQVLEFFNLPEFDFVNLVSPTLSTKPWHSLSLSVEMIDASWDLHCSNCWATLLRMLLILLIIAWIKSFSTFLIIFLALVVFKVDFSLILTGDTSLCRHLKVNILWFL